MKLPVEIAYRTAKRIAVAVVGSTILLIGIIMLAAPGPGLLVVPIGLAILAVEFAWARVWLRKLRETISERMANSRGDAAQAHRDRHDPG